MTAIDEYTAALTWLDATIRADAALLPGLVTDICEHPAPQGAVYPLITVQRQSAHDVMEVAANRIWTQFLFVVTVVGQTESSLALAAANKRLDALLHRVDGSTSDAYVISSTRQEPWSDAETVNGVSYRRVGGIYEVLIQPA